MSSSSSDTENNSYQSDVWLKLYSWAVSNRVKSMKTPVKRSQAAPNPPIIRAHDFGPYVNEPVPDEDWLKSYREKKQSRRTS
jgi:hypothetical protein